MRILIGKLSDEDALIEIEGFTTQTGQYVRKEMVFPWHGLNKDKWKSKGFGHYEADDGLLYRFVNDKGTFIELSSISDIARLIKAVEYNLIIQSPDPDDSGYDLRFWIYDDNWE